MKSDIIPCVFHPLITTTAPCDHEYHPNRGMRRYSMFAILKYGCVMIALMVGLRSSRRCNARNSHDSIRLRWFKHINKDALLLFPGAVSFFPSSFAEWMANPESHSRSSTYILFCVLGHVVRRRYPNEERSIRYKNIGRWNFVFWLMWSSTQMHKRNTEERVPRA